MEDIDKNGDGFIDLEEYIGKFASSLFLRRGREALEYVFTHGNNLPHGSTVSTSLSQISVRNSGL